jgi:hypothetical protein
VASPLQHEMSADVSSGSWLCKNARTLNRDKRSVAALHVRPPGSGQGIVRLRLAYFERSSASPADVRFGVKNGKAQGEHMFSAVHPTTDITKILRYVRSVRTAEVVPSAHPASSAPISGALSYFKGSGWSPSKPLVMTVRATTGSSECCAMRSWHSAAICSASCISLSSL